MLEAKVQEHNAQVFSKKKLFRKFPVFSKQKKGSSQIFFEDTGVVQDKAKTGHDHGPFLMFKKGLFSTEDTGHCEDLEASRPRPRTY